MYWDRGYCFLRLGWGCTWVRFVCLSVCCVCLGLFLLFVVGPPFLLGFGSLRSGFLFPCGVFVGVWLPPGWASSWVPFRFSPCVGVRHEQQRKDSIMEYATTLTPSNVEVTWTQDVGYITNVVYDVSTRTILVVWDGKVVKCRIGGYERELAVSLWKALTKAKEARDLVYLFAKGNWSPNEWFCGVFNHTEEWLDAEESLHSVVEAWQEEQRANRLLP